MTIKAATDPPTLEERVLDLEGAMRQLLQSEPDPSASWIVVDPNDLAWVLVGVLAVFALSLTLRLG